MEDQPAQILKLIKQRASTRQYLDKPIPKEIVDQIVEAGIWGPSLLVGFQPWKFVVIDGKITIEKIGEILNLKAEQIGVGGSNLLRISAKTAATASMVIVVYNNRSLTKFVKRFKNIYGKMAGLAELSAISMAVQNMFLVAETLNVGSCWHDSALLAKKEINKLLKKKEPLIAILTFGYPAKPGQRSKRINFSQAVEFSHD
ncbi:MAG: nitroreductase family protein [Candidatus Omnitrophica bacterium]|nr:nitroreductase family protein [Candidatus Omnitrophota bacterium]